jgi:D-aminoacyl-tRNA deacylase
MRLVLQRVSSASVVIDGATRAQIGRGLLVLAGLEEGDTDAELEWAAAKLAEIRIFEDEQGKMNLSVRDVGGEVLLVPNFTLAGDARKGRRPSFDRAMKPDAAAPAFERFAAMVAARGVGVQVGVFRAHMAVSLVNDGPVTIVLDSRNRAAPAG